MTNDEGRLEKVSAARPVGWSYLFVLTGRHGFDIATNNSAVVDENVVLGSIRVAADDPQRRIAWQLARDGQVQLVRRQRHIGCKRDTHKRDALF